MKRGTSDLVRGTGTCCSAAVAVKMATVQPPWQRSAMLRAWSTHAHRAYVVRCLDERRRLRAHKWLHADSNFTNEYFPETFLFNQTYNGEFKQRSRSIEAQKQFR